MIKIIVLAASILTQSVVSVADVLPTERKDLNVIKVSKSESSELVRFELCGLSTVDLKTMVGCEPIGREEGYTIDELESQRIIEKWQARGIWIAAGVVVVGSTYAGVALGALFAMVGSDLAAAGFIGIFSVPAGGIAGLVGGVYAVKNFNVLQTRDPEYFSSEVINDESVEVFEDTTILEYADRLELLLGKLDKE